MKIKDVNKIVCKIDVIFPNSSTLSIVFIFAYNPTMQYVFSKQQTKKKIDYIVFIGL